VNREPLTITREGLHLLGVKQGLFPNFYRGRHISPRLEQKEKAGEGPV